MIDPVSRFEYPDAWVSLCKDRTDLALVQYGLAVLTSDGRVLKRGFTTGTSAAAACKGAIMSLGGDEIHSVKIQMPCGLTYPVEIVAKDGVASCFKYSGDYPSDATAGIELKARFIDFQHDIVLDIGSGIGIWNRDTPRYDQGSPAISHTAMDCIVRSISAACTARGREGALVHLEAVDGKKRALRTLNHKIGIENGISILGSTGLVEPWDDHLGQDSVKRVMDAERAVVTTGRVGLKHARLQFPDSDVVLVGANMGPALDSRNDGLILFGLPALIIRFIEPDILENSRYKTIEELVFSADGPRVVHSSILKFKSRYPGHGITIIDRDGRVLGASR
ncbi:MAG: cobalt-precorrin-5B (C(1))-methyltransferase [Methanomassiliicoccales archaeon]|jgi:cobalt-precorrin-5B (C1)-methyltransferase